MKNEDTNGVTANQRTDNGKRTETKGHTMNYKTIHTRLKIWDESRYSGRIITSCSTSGTCCVTFVTIPMICHESGKDRNISVVICDTDIP